MKNPLEFLFENDKFPDTDSEVIEVFTENTKDATAVDIEGKEVDDREELDEGKKK